MKIQNIHEEQKSDESDSDFNFGQDNNFAAKNFR